MESMIRPEAYYVSPEDLFPKNILGKKLEKFIILYIFYICNKFTKLYNI